MNEITSNLFMSTKEVADVLNVSDRFIRETVQKLRNSGSALFSNMQTNSQGGYLFNEAQVTAIKLELETHSKVNVLTPKTELEENMIIQQAMDLLNTRIVKMHQALIEKQKTIELMKPLAEFGARVGQCKELLTVREAAKVLNLGYGVQTFYKKLVADGYLMENHEPYQEYLNKGYFRVVESSYNDGWNEHLTKTTKITQKGLEFLSRKYGDKDAR